MKVRTNHVSLIMSDIKIHSRILVPLLIFKFIAICNIMVINCINKILFYLNILLLSPIQFVITIIKDGGALTY